MRWKGETKRWLRRHFIPEPASSLPAPFRTFYNAPEMDVQSVSAAAQQRVLCKAASMEETKLYVAVILYHEPR